MIRENMNRILVIVFCFLLPAVNAEDAFSGADDEGSSLGRMLETCDDFGVIPHISDSYNPKNIYWSGGGSTNEWIDV
jgi:hypothetical protein